MNRANRVFHKEHGVWTCPFCNQAPYFDVNENRYRCENQECEQKPYTIKAESQEMAKQLWNTENFENV